jgi:hypothetical protein
MGELFQCHCGLNLATELAGAFFVKQVFPCFLLFGFHFTPAHLSLCHFVELVISALNFSSQQCSPLCRVYQHLFVLLRQRRLVCQSKDRTCIPAVLEPPPPRGPFCSFEVLSALSRSFQGPFVAFGGIWRRFGVGAGCIAGACTMRARAARLGAASEHSGMHPLNSKP